MIFCMEIARHWRLKEGRYNLVAEICRSEECNGSIIYPPRDICPNCKEEAHEKFKLSGYGEVYSFTSTDKVPAGYEEQAPLSFAMVKLIEGPLMLTQLTDLESNVNLEEQVEIGTPVKMVTRLGKADGERGMLIYIPKFRQLLSFEEEQFDRLKGEVRELEKIRFTLQSQQVPLRVGG